MCGWFGVIGAILGAIGVLLTAIFGRQFISDHFTPVGTASVSRNDGSATAIIIAAIISLIILAIYFYCSWKLLKGTENVSSIVFHLD